jgi:hypothetical protein
MTTLDDLKRAIDRYQVAIAKESIGIELQWRACALTWRAAFEWRHKWADLRDSAMSESMQREYEEGMRLIREKLR